MAVYTKVLLKDRSIYIYIYYHKYKTIKRKKSAGKLQQSQGNITSVYSGNSLETFNDIEICPENSIV